MIINRELVLENEVVHGSLEVQDGEMRRCRKPEPPARSDGRRRWLATTRPD